MVTWNTVAMLTGPKCFFLLHVVIVEGEELRLGAGHVFQLVIVVIVHSVVVGFSTSNFCGWDKGNTRLNCRRCSRADLVSLRSPCSLVLLVLLLLQSRRRQCIALASVFVGSLGLSCLCFSGRRMGRRAWSRRFSYISRSCSPGQWCRRRWWWHRNCVGRRRRWRICRLPPTTMGFRCRHETEVVLDVELV